MHLQALEKYWYRNKNKCKPPLWTGRKPSMFLLNWQARKVKRQLNWTIGSSTGWSLKLHEWQNYQLFLKKAWYFLQQKQHVVIRGWAVLLSQLKRRTRLQFQLTQHKLIVLCHNTALEILCILHFTLYSFIGGKEQFQKNSCLTSDRKIIVVLLSTLHPPSFLWLLFFCLLYFFFPRVL